eukprot:CAMPEP_0195286882 /NCGR_PEP_ID=MMETSP0707-20130614/4174_1 /TAXON_ID=33640 /ORGANISM="Asterionellopsis glacialis, Strain CCMP134" /LENGTH=268 /DNA_ID=CAMNT_0040346579 /DNA_START=148 /DNA_END=954 /DNA_ORIENTATION=+
MPLKPRKNDVLCGRGSIVDEHPGNTHFRQIVNQYKSEYMQVGREGKRTLALAVIKQLKQMVPPARFLVRDMHTGDWMEADHQTAYNKTTQTLRQKHKRRRRKMSSSLPPNKRTITIQGTQRYHQELIQQHSGVGLQQAIPSNLNHPYLHIASASEADNPIHPEKQYYGNMIGSTQQLCTTPGGKQNNCLQPDSVTSGSIAGTVKHMEATKTKNKNENSISTGADIPVPVPVSYHSGEVQESTSAEDNTSAEAKYRSNVFIKAEQTNYV